jgi:hypothetical protein
MGGQDPASDSDGAQVDGPRDRPDRPAEDDHDLLTFGEAGARLHGEVRAMRERVRVLTNVDPVDQQALAAARSRLAVLEEGFERNTAQAINDDNFERFFGYPGKARRNTS